MRIKDSRILRLEDFQLCFGKGNGGYFLSNYGVNIFYFLLLGRRIIRFFFVGEDDILVKGKLVSKA